MNDGSMVSVDQLAEFTRELDWSEYQYRDDWLEMFASLSGASVPCQVLERDYVLDMYRRRLESAIARGDGGLNGLDHAVSWLEASVDTHFVFVLISWEGRGFFLWLSQDASKLVAYWLGVDVRGRA